MGALVEDEGQEGEEKESQEAEVEEEHQQVKAQDTPPRKSTASVRRTSSAPSRFRDEDLSDEDSGIFPVQSAHRRTSRLSLEELGSAGKGLSAADAQALAHQFKSTLLHNIDTKANKESLEEGPTTATTQIVEAPSPPQSPNTDQDNEEPSTPHNTGFFMVRKNTIERSKANPSSKRTDSFYDTSNYGLMIVRGLNQRASIVPNQPQDNSENYRSSISVVSVDDDATDSSPPAYVVT
jgi:hypothetical protein